MTNVTMTMLDGATEPELRSLSAAGGTAIAFTCRAPDKQTDNEDTVGVIPCGDDAVVLAVADGAGGLPAGRRASRTAVGEFSEAVEASYAASPMLRVAVLNGIEAANRAVLDIGGGAATTLTVVVVEGRSARTFQIGDSEALIVGQRGRIRAQTMAHSPTGFAVEAGFLDLRDALHHEERHLVSNFLGAADMRIDVGATIELQALDTVLVASDGLTDNLHLHEIVDIIRKGPLDAAATALTRLATRRMTVESKSLPSKPDDLSLILFRKPWRRAAPAAAAGAADAGSPRGRPD